MRNDCAFVVPAKAETKRVARSPIPWFGGKQRLAPWIVSHLPEHDTYCEPFGGAASVILAKQPSQRDVYNDLDGGVANFFRIVRDRSDELVRRILLSPYHRGEYFAALDGMDEHPDDMERARRFYVVAHQSFSALFGKSWARSSPEARGWGTRCLADLYLCADRLRSVIVENRPAAKVIELEDSPATAFLSLIHI